MRECHLSAANRDECFPENLIALLKITLLNDTCPVKLRFNFFTQINDLFSGVSCTVNFYFWSCSEIVVDRGLSCLNLVSVAGVSNFKRLD